MSDHVTQPLILTARMDAPTQLFFQQQRNHYFPPERNIVPAHLTLFHHLPSSLYAEIDDVLKYYAANSAPIEAQCKALRFLGRGVAYDIHAPALQALRAELAERWQPLLIPQDKAPIRPHITVQNKVDPNVAKACLEELQAAFQPRAFVIIGLDLWRYEGGPWTALKSFSFRGRA